VHTAWLHQTSYTPRSVSGYSYGRESRRGRGSAHGYMGARMDDGKHGGIIHHMQMQFAFPNDGG
jgi:hypothetical protein